MTACFIGFWIRMRAGWVAETVRWYELLTDNGIERGYQLSTNLKLAKESPPSTPTFPVRTYR